MPRPGSLALSHCLTDHALAPRANALDPVLNHVTRPEIAGGYPPHPHTSGSAGRDDVTRQQGHVLADARDQTRHAEDQRGGARVLARLTVDRAKQPRIFKARLIARYQIGAEGSKGIGALAFHELTTA